MEYQATVTINHGHGQVDTLGPYTVAGTEIQAIAAAHKRAAADYGNGRYKRLRMSTFVDLAEQASPDSQEQASPDSQEQASPDSS